MTERLQEETCPWWQAGNSGCREKGARYTLPGPTYNCTCSYSSKLNPGQHSAVRSQSLSKHGAAGGVTLAINRREEEKLRAGPEGENREETRRAMRGSPVRHSSHWGEWEAAGKHPPPSLSTVPPQGFFSFSGWLLMWEPGGTQEQQPNRVVYSTAPTHSHGEMEAPVTLKSFPQTSDLRLLISG